MRSGFSLNRSIETNTWYQFIFMKAEVRYILHYSLVAVSIKEIYES